MNCIFKYSLFFIFYFCIQFGFSQENEPHSKRKYKFQQQKNNSRIYSQIKEDVNQHEIGGFIGTSYYLGDINKIRLFALPGFTRGFLYRHNFNYHWAFKFNFLITEVSGENTDFNINFSQYRGTAFKKQLLDIGSTFEFNFLNFKEKISGYNQTFYLTFGWALSTYSSNKSISLPIGMGYKYAYNKRVTIGLEWTFRKLFNDKLDGISDPYYFDSHSSIINNDWYSLFGFTITYGFYRYDNNCHKYTF